MNDGQKTILKREGDTGILFINNPPENYLEAPDFIDIEKLRSFIETGIKALIIGGTGRHFSAGANLQKMKESIKDFNRFTLQMADGNRLLGYLDNLDIPVIAAISGVCFGAGLEIALACDIRICEEYTLFAFPEINHELFPGLGGTQRLVDTVGKATALELILGGDMINARKALALQIIDEVVPKKQAMEHVANLAKKLTVNRSLKVINAVMRSVRNHRLLTPEEAIQKDAQMFANLAMEMLGNQNPENE